MPKETKIRVGVLAQYLSSRNDIRSLVQSLNNQCEVYLYLKKADKTYSNFFNKSINIQLISNSGTRYWNYFLSVLYKLFGKIPKSKNNYYITEKFKITNSGFKKINYYFELLLLNLSKITPKFITYDKYLDLLTGKRNLIKSEIDVFFCVTQIYDDKHFANIIRTGKKVYNYVYSWDHPCKMKCFSKKENVFYLVWSKQIKEDLIELHGINHSNIFIYGATQFMYLHQYLHNKKAISIPPAAYKYVYLAMSTGTSGLTSQEIKLFDLLIRKMTEIDSDIKILIRPYPFLKNWEPYDILSKHPSVTIEDNFRENASSFLVSEENLFNKYKTIERSHLFIHCGTTLGIEASILNVPVLFVDLGKEMDLLQLDTFVHQYQNDKYLNLKEYPNVITTSREFTTVFKDSLLSVDSFLPYNIPCQMIAIPKGIKELTDSLIKYFSNVNTINQN